MSLPIVITKGISDDSDIIEKEDIGYVLQEQSISEYTNACKKIDKLNSTKEKTTLKIRNVALKYRNFDVANKVYEKLYS